MKGNPRVRRAVVDLPDNRATILPCIVQGVFQQKEADVVLQAIGRVRPFTRPREVIVCHAGELPGVVFDVTFNTLAMARNYFGYRCRRRAELESKVERARHLRQAGYSRSEIADAMGVNLSSVKRYLKTRGAHESLQ